MRITFSPLSRVSGWVMAACIGALSAQMSHGVAAQGTNGDTPFGEAYQEQWPFHDLSFTSAYIDGQIRREAAERLARFPDSVNTVAWLAHAHRLNDALDVLQRIVARHPTRIAEGLDALGPLVLTLRRDGASEPSKQLARLLDSARARLPELDRESAARLAQEILRLDVVRSRIWQRLPDTYQGTLVARLAALSELEGNGSSELAEYDAIAEREGANEVGARARLAKASAIKNAFERQARATGNHDPTESWLEVLAIVRDLESGRYPSGPWVEDAAQVARFSLDENVVSPPNAARLIETLRLFAVEHEALLAASRFNPILPLITSTMPELARFMPDGVAVMERQFAELGRELRDPATAPYLKALWLDSPERRSQRMALPPRSATHESEVRALLASAAAATSDSFHARMALAHLADRESRDPASFGLAHAHFEEYLRRFGSGPVAVLVALRLGHIEHEQGRYAAAVTRFEGVARTNRDEPVVRALALAYAARASEDDERFDAARDYYREAARVWTPDLGERLGVSLPSRPKSPLDDALPGRDRGDVLRAEVQRRLDELNRSMVVRAGAQIERGRWLVRQSRTAEAVPVLERAARDLARTSASAEAQRVLASARLEAAIDLADVSKPVVDRAAALAALDAIAKERAAGAGIAGILAATLIKLQGRDAEAGARMTTTLSEWAARSVRTRTAPRPGSLEADVLAVRDVLGAQWNAVSPSTVRRPFVIAPAEVRVILPGRKERTSIDVSRQPPGATNVVFVTDEDIAILTGAVLRIGGTSRRQPTVIMEVPNQPTGDAQTIIRWWNEFFAARPGHWSGFDLMTSPTFVSIEFTNAERTRARVPVTYGYSGADVFLERINGVWTVTGSDNEWIT